MFFITTNKKKAGLIKEDYKQIYKYVSVYEYFNMSVITTSKSSKKMLIKSFEENTILIAGTIFNKDSFNETLINSYKDFNIFVEDLKSNAQKFFGHYVVIIIDAARKSVEVVTDRVGLINVYYTMSGEGNYISDDLLEIGKINNSKLYDQAVYEFLLTESNVGKESIFEDVFRLSFGKQLLLQNEVIKEKDIYDYRIETLSKEEYIKRIEYYFKCFNNFAGKISTDLSAGYDTRLINAIAYKTIEHFEGFNNKNINVDRGCDGEISKIMADRLDIKLHCFDANVARECGKDDYLTVLRETGALRDAKRSRRLGILLENKYKICDLAIGGYGGEVVRAKYNKYTGMIGFVANYYQGDEGEKICKFKDYSNKVMNELKEYRTPGVVDSEILQNWYYAVARMRIWGSGFIHLSLLYGDVVHPFMDWYLLNPLFGFKKEELCGAKLQLELINTFAPQLSDLPINAKMNTSVKNMTVKKNIENVLISNIMIKRVYYRCRNIIESFMLTDNMAEELLNYSNMDVKRISKKCGKRVAQRMQTIISACRYGEFPSKSLRLEKDMQ